MTNDEQCILSSVLANSIKLVDKNNGMVLNSFEGHVNKEYKVDSCVMQNDTHVVTGSEDGHIFFWDLIEAKIVTKIEKAHLGVIYSLSIHPTENLLLTAATDGVKLWNSQENIDKDEKEK